MEVLIYAGDVDYICNWLGNKKWVKALDWEGKEGFNEAEDEPWSLTTGISHRKHKYSNNPIVQRRNSGKTAYLSKLPVSPGIRGWAHGAYGQASGCQ